jgi:hypothetical protein
MAMKWDDLEPAPNEVPDTSEKAPASAAPTETPKWDDLIDDPDKAPPGTLGTYGETIAQAVKQTPAYIASAFEGKTPYSERTKADEAIERANKEQEEFQNAPGAKSKVLGGLAEAGEVREQAPSMASSLAGMAPTAAGAAIGSAIMPGVGTAVGAGLGGILGYVGMKRAAENQLVRSVIAKQEATAGRPLTQAEKLAAQEKALASGEVEKYGNAEAGGELAGQAAEGIIALTPAGKALKAATSFIPSRLGKAAAVGVGKALGVTGTEIATETGTQQFQQPVESKLGLTDEAPRELTSPSDWLTSAKEVAKPTALTVLPMVGIGGVTGGVQEYKSTAPKPEVENGAETEQNPTTEAAPQPNTETSAQPAIGQSVAEDFEDVGQPAENPTINVPPNGFDTKESEDFLNRFESAWAGTPNGAPLKPTKQLANEAAKLGVNVAPNDDPKAVIAAMRSEIEARKPAEQKIAEAVTTAAEDSNAEILASYPDGSPGVVGKAALDTNNAGISSVAQNAAAAKEQELAAQQEQELAAQQVPVEPPVGVDSETGEVTVDEPLPDYSVFTVPQLTKWINSTTRTISPEQREAMRAARDAKKANREEEASDASQIREDQGLPTEPGQIGEGSQIDSRSDVHQPVEGPSQSGETATPGQPEADRNIPGTEEITQPTIEDQNGESTYQAEKTTPQEVTEKADPTEAARTMLLSVAPSGELNALTGKHNVDNRVRLIEALTGVKPAKNKATNELLRQVFYDAAGINPDQTIRDKELQFAAWATQTEVEKAPEVVEKLAEAGITQKYPVDFAAHKESAASRHNGHRELPENRDAQKKAYIEIQGMPIGIENPAGTQRRPEWPELKGHYGFFTGVKGADGDYLDVFVKPKLTQDDLDNIKSVFVVDQIEPAAKGRGNFDEAKVMLGYKSLADARKGYLANYSKGWRGMGAITEMPIEQFKARIESGKAWDAPVTYVQDATKMPNARKPPTGLEELQKAVGKLGGLKRSLADREGFSDYKGRPYQYIFHTGSDAKTFDEMAELLRTYGYDVSGGNDLVEKLTNSLNGVPFYSPEGAELYAEHLGEEYKSDDQLRAENDFLADVDAADIPEVDKEGFRADIQDGDFDLERDRRILDDLIARHAPQFSRRAAPGQTDLFASSKEELAALKAKQEVADYAAQKDKRRQGDGAEPPPLFSDHPRFMGQVDIEDKEQSLAGLFQSLGKFDKAPETINHPDAERIRYVQDNFLDLLGELETNKKVEIKC